ncbi:MAG: acyl-CoA thioesterase II [Bacteroidota bacterium]
MKSIKELVDLLSLEQIDENIYRGQNYQAPWGRVFGGQVMAQAAHAARRTVPEDRYLHSLHGYFILSGDISVPIIFQVDRIRDGRSFTTRRVVAIQKGRAIFNLSASFQIREEGLEHQIAMPNVPSPDALITDKEWAAQYQKELPDLYKRYSRDRPIEFRPVERFDPVNRRNQQPFRHIWLRAKGGITDEPSLHQEILAYASDYNLMGTSLLPHRTTFDQKFMQMASLDHAMWFYQDFKVNDWLLYALDSPVASNSRGLNRGNFFNQAGKLVASVVQEGLIRNRKPK